MGNFRKLLETLGNLQSLLWLGEPKGILGNLKRLLCLGEPKEISGTLKRLLWLGEPMGFLGYFGKALLAGGASGAGVGEPPRANTIVAPLDTE